MSGDKTGVCHVCGETKKLTLEHIPPKSVFNDSNAKLYDIVSMAQNEEKKPWEFSGKYKQHQGGFGKYTLCEQCNNNIGAWYVVDYAKFISKLHCQVNGILLCQNGVVVMNVSDVYPLRIFKAILAMFCSVNHNRFSAFSNIKKLLLNKDEKGFDASRSLSMYVYGGGEVMRQIGQSVIIRSDSTSRRVSEIGWYPFGYIFDWDKSNNEDFDITDFAKYGYDEKVDIRLELIARELNAPMPVDFRSKQEIIEQADKGDTTYD